ncbi:MULTISPECIES: recombination protein NinG [Pantoea]|uniref:Protein NinG n=1 Tax=Candidatus Pantoea gossypiicola TaxID=2608008 RepID=A0AB34CPA3_9GAMM|nr:MULTISPECIES: recombination protein NinG [Pantoea]KAA5961035.1 protein NinG [Pantoea sp. VH_24]KAA5964424.1 protein NinG [Pantoea sp. VH_16]KAA5968638.1 protein NinG [Pantoea sp. VH_18]KAA6004295.1 protein NinG [Pantoea sp. M_1]KAA6006779.1 protein NinG [Pantoea sp. F_7]
MKTKSKKRVYKPKTCPQCLTVFTPDRYLQKVCGPVCAVSYQRAARVRLAERDKKDKLKIRKLEVKPLSYFRAKAQEAFNAYIRERDAAEPCISCGRFHDGQYHAGHYRTVGSNPELRFDEDNCHKQCSACNNHKSGNLSQYRPNLITKIGQARFDRLVGPHELKHYGRNDYEEIARLYRHKVRALKKERAA